MSLNTALLQVFHRLSAVGRSFSVGDVAFLRTPMFNELLRAGAETAWAEHELRIPLRNQCTCEACAQESVPKCAVDVKAVGAFVIVRLKPFPSASIPGLMQALSEALGTEVSHYVRGCANRSFDRRPYSHGAYDTETYTLICVNKDEALQEFHSYNQVRMGSEFFVPSVLVC